MPAAVEPVIAPAVRSARKLSVRMQDDGVPVDVFVAADAAVTDVVFDTFLGAASAEGRKCFNAAGIELTRQMGKLNPADIFNLPNWTRPLLGMTARRPADDLHALVAELLTDETLADKQLGQLQLLRMLASAVDPETGTAMNPVRLRENIVGALAAGRETTALALAWTLWLVARHRPTRERLALEAAALPVEEELTAETLRSATLTCRLFVRRCGFTRPSRRSREPQPKQSTWPATNCARAIRSSLQPTPCIAAKTIGPIRTPSIRTAFQQSDTMHALPACVTCRSAAGHASASAWPSRLWKCRRCSLL